VSAVLYNFLEEFQLYNNDYFSLSFILLFDVLIVFYYCAKKVLLPFAISILSLIFFINASFYNMPTFYKGISVSYTAYIELKNKRYDSSYSPRVDDDLPSMYSFSDIVLSFYNSFPRHNKNLCTN
jgi:hypothetical protein